MFTAPHWIADPITNITTATFMDSFRPNRSAIGPLIRDPNHAATLCQLCFVQTPESRLWTHTEEQCRHKPSLEATVCVYSRESSSKGFHCNDPRYHALIISEEETSQSWELQQISQLASSANRYTYMSSPKQRPVNRDSGRWGQSPLERSDL